MTMWDCALSDDHREQVEAAIRDVIVTSARRDDDEIGEVLRYVPPHVPGQDEEEHFEVDALPGLSSIEVASPPQRRFLTATVYLHGLPEGVTLTADVVDWEDENPEDWPVEEGEPDQLANLSDEYASLSASLLDILAWFTDAPPEDAPEQWWIGSGRQFDATTCAPGHYTFGAMVSYPEQVEAIYVEGRRDIAQQLGLPL